MFKSLSAAAAFAARTGYTGPFWCIYLKDGPVLRATTDRAALIRLFNRAYANVPGLHATTVWGPTYDVRR